MTPEDFDKEFKYKLGTKFGMLPATSMLWEIIARELRQNYVNGRKVIPIYTLHDEFDATCKLSEEELDKEFSSMKNYTDKLKAPTSDIYSKEDTFLVVKLKPKYLGFFEQFMQYLQNESKGD